MKLVPPPAVELLGSYCVGGERWRGVGGVIMAGKVGTQPPAPAHSSAMAAGTEQRAACATATSWFVFENHTLPCSII